jgi:iron complex transport system substrate-binding protein
MEFSMPGTALLSRPAAFSPVHDATRRTFLTAAGSALFLSACSRDTKNTEGQAPSTRTVDTTHGPIQVPTVPRRVVAMHDQLVAYSIASLGFADLAAVASRDAKDPSAAIVQFGPVPEGFRDLVDIGTYAEPNLEAIARIGPDLIIGLSQEVDPVYDQLSRIAPTVVIAPPEGRRPEFQLQRSLAAVVGLEGRLDERLAEYGTRLGTVKAKVGAKLAGAAYTAIESYGTGAEDNYVIVSDYAPGLQVAEDLGMVRSSTTKALAEEYTTISLERMAEFDADVIFLEIPEGGAVDQRIMTLLGTTVAGKAGQIFTVSRDIWGVEVVEARFRALADFERLFGDRQIQVSGRFA